MYRQAYGLQFVRGILFNHESPDRSDTFVSRKIVDEALRCRLEPGFGLQLGDLSVARDWGWAGEYVEAIQLILRSDEIEDQVLCTGRME